MRTTRTRTKSHLAKVPFPDIVSGEGGWKIFEDAERPRTSNMSKEMYVPFGDKCPLPMCESYHAKQIRRHELAHVKWSPKTIGKLTEDESEIAVEVIEEVRIGYLLAQREMSIDDWVMCQKKVLEKHEEMILVASEFEIICYLLASMWNSTNGYQLDENGNIFKDRYRSHFQANNFEYESFKEVYEELKAKDNGLYLTKLRTMQVDFALDRAGYFYNRLIRKRKNSYWSDNSYKPTYRKTRQVAKELNLLRDDFDEQPEEHQVLEASRLAHEARQNAKQQQANMDNKGEGDGEGSGLSLEERNYQTKQQVTHDRMRTAMNYKPSDDYSGDWGVMDVIQGPLEVNMQSQLNKGREYRPMEYGTNPKYINRYCVDKKIFKQKQRTYGGTILIDASGSMAFNGQDILEIMQELPAVTIAMYNDRTESREWEKGALRIIGAGGKRVTTDYLSKWSGGGNLVDGPALDWLAKQKPARIWVSDMYVFGKHNSNSYNLLQDCYQKMKRNNITRLANIEEVKQFALEINRLQ
tara:strand:+ start:8898 stop:10469 length:1572 start_codon:yes stop_codon:yes gene_type:complete